MMYILGMCESLKVVWTLFGYVIWAIKVCLLYTSDAADE